MSTDEKVARLEERIEAIERTIVKLSALARCHPLGRKLLAALGVSADAG